MRYLLVVVAIFMALACSRYEEDEYVYEPAPGQGDDTGGGDTGDGGSQEETFDTLKPLVAKNCGGCHNGSVHPLKFDTEAKLRQPKVLARVKNGSMPPPPAQLLDEDKARLVAFLE